jgi:hypothetical protein
MENRRKHLEMIQGVITRMGANSFLLKGWSVTLVAALIALASVQADKRFVIVACFPIVLFWILDAYYLRQERLFRKLYDHVRALDEESIDFSMSTSAFSKDVSPWALVAFSATLSIFYGAMLLGIALALLLVIV